MTNDLPLPVQMPQLERHSDCDLCILSEGVRTVCVPTTAVPVSIESANNLNSNTALLVVGEAPGASEDRMGEPFVGKTGQILRQLYLDYFKFSEKANIWLANAVRCRPPDNDTPKKSFITACRPYLLDDIEWLRNNYKEVIVLAVGGTACRSVLGSGLKDSLYSQGQQMPGHEGVCVFTTYHPAYLLRQPSMGLTVKRHLQLLDDYLSGRTGLSLEDSLDIETCPDLPDYPVKRLSLDIETYGKVSSYNSQTMFHPVKSEELDGIQKRDLVQTTGISWYDPDGKLHHGIFYMDNLDHRRRLWSWILRCHRTPEFEYLLGQNISFDLSYLRYAYAEARILLNHKLPIMDLLVLNYLQDESRPEKSLKALAPLYRVTKFDEGHKGEGGEYLRYDDVRDPELAQYNCQDTAATIILAEKLESEIREFYGEKTQKLSPFCYKWYSDILWSVIYLEETGVYMDSGELWNLFHRYKHALNSVVTYARDIHKLKLSGQGSERGKGEWVGKRDVIDAALEELVERKIRVPDLERTKGGQPSFSVENRNILLGCLPKDSYVYRLLKVIGTYQDVSGLLDRYLYPLLVGRGKDHDKLDSVLYNGFAYPRWFPVPTEFVDKSTGGTKQSRIVAKLPAIQTFPKSIKNTIKCRFSGGYAVWFDYSQIELRVAALLSNDPAMMEEYRGKPDLHGRTAKLMFGDDITDHRDYRSKYRQAGKTFNFRALYRGGAKKAQESLMQDLGIRLEIPEIYKIDDDFWARHWRLKQWQDELMDYVSRHGYYELPIIGQSRLFLGGKSAQSSAINEIVNLPVQAMASNIMLSSQTALQFAFRQRRMRAVVSVNIYDAALVECPRQEIGRVRDIFNQVLWSPPFYTELCTHLGRSLPLEVDVDEYRMPRKQRRILGAPR